MVLNISTQKETKISDSKITFLKRKNSPVAVFISFLAGASLDPEGKEGTAHLLEHLLLKKSSKYPNSEENRNNLEIYGSTVNAFTNTDQMAFFLLSSNNKYFYKSLDIFLENIFNPKFRKKEVEREKNIVKSELNDIKSNPESTLWKLLYRKLYFKGTLLERSLLGSEISFNKINKKIVDEYHQKYIKEGYSDILVVGDVNEEKIIDKLNNFFNKYSLASNEKEKILAERRNRLKSYEDSGVQIEVERFENTDSTYVSLGFRTQGVYSEDFFTLSLIANVLGKGTSSTLFTKIREKLNLVYDIWIDDIFLLDTGSLEVLTSTSNDDLDLLIKEILKEFVKIKEEGLPKKVIEETKLKIINRAELNYETVQSIGNGFHYDYLVNSGITPFDYFENIKKVTSQDIKRVSNKYFIKDNLKVGFCGDVDKNGIRIDF